MLDERCELAEAISTVAAGDKLGGWQRSAARMVLVFQLYSEDNLHLMFGDSGHAVRGQPGRFRAAIALFCAALHGRD